jgi:Xaa-Pro aminopeptidase
MNTRLQNLRKLMSEENLDAVFISSIPNIYYLTDFSDFTTFDRDGFLLVTAKEQYIFTHGIYKEAVETNVSNFKLIQMLRENPISKAIKNIVDQEKINKLGFEAFDIKVNEYKRLLHEVDEKMLFETDIVNRLRIKKNSGEVNAITKACQIGDKAFEYILGKLTPGVTESELAVELEFFVKRNYADLSFPSVIAFGSNASKPHHVPTNTKLKKNQFVLFDFGVKYYNYCSDMTRTVFYGKATPEQKKVYQAVLESQLAASNKITSLLAVKGSLIKASEIDKISRTHLTSQGYPEMPHSLGHGIGLEVHETPRLTPLSKAILENGNVFSIEPGIYIPGEYGIRIEDLYVIDNGKFKQLTNAPKNLIEL